MGTIASLSYFLVAAGVGAFCGYAELRSRYVGVRRIAEFASARKYLALNAIAGYVAYVIAVDFDLGFGLNRDHEIWRAILAGSVAMVVIRSSFANLKVGTNQVSAGLGAALEVFLRHTERQFDQTTSEMALKQVAAVVAQVSYEKAQQLLPAICLGSMQGISSDEERRLLDNVTKISTQEVDSATKMQLLGLLLTRTMGLDLFKCAIDSNLERLRIDVAAEKESRRALNERLNEAKKTLGESS